MIIHSVADQMSQALLLGPVLSCFRPRVQSIAETRPAPCLVNDSRQARYARFGELAVGRPSVGLACAFSERIVGNPGGPNVLIATTVPLGCLNGGVPQEELNLLDSGGHPDRRQAVSAGTLSHIDLKGNAGHTRTIPMPEWVKALLVTSCSTRGRYHASRFKRVTRKYGFSFSAGSIAKSCEVFFES